MGAKILLVDQQKKDVEGYGGPNFFDGHREVVMYRMAGYAQMCGYLFVGHAVDAAQLEHTAALLRHVFHHPLEYQFRFFGDHVTVGLDIERISGKKSFRSKFGVDCAASYMFVSLVFSRTEKVGFEIFFAD